MISGIQRWCSHKESAWQVSVVSPFFKYSAWLLLTLQRELRIREWFWSREFESVLRRWRIPQCQQMPGLFCHDSQPWLPRWITGKVLNYPCPGLPPEVELIRWGSRFDTYFTLPDAVWVRQKENFAETTCVTQVMHLSEGSLLCMRHVSEACLQSRLSRRKPCVYVLSNHSGHI